MARPMLGDFIRNIDFLGARMKSEYSSNLDNPCRQINDFEQKIRHDVTLDELKDAFTQYERKVAIKDYPGKYSKDPKYFTGTHFLARDTADVLVQLLRRVVEREGGKDDPKLMAEAGELLLHAWLAIVSVGPHATHIAVMDLLAEDYKLPLKKYICTLPSSRIVSILRTMDISLQLPKVEINPKEFGGMLQCRLGKMSEAFTPEQLAEVQTEFLDVYYNYHTQFLTLSEDLASGIKHLIKGFGQNFAEGNPYLRLTNVDTFKKHITVIKDFVLSDAMGKSTPVADRAERTLNLIIKALIADQGNMLDAVFDHLMETIAQISRHPRARQHSDTVFEIYGYELFDGMRQASVAPSDSMFESCQKMISEVFASGDTTTAMDKMVQKAQDGLVLKIKQNPASKAKSILKTVKDMLLSGKKDLVNKAAKTIDNAEYKKGKVFVWKELVPDAIMLIDVVGKQPVERMEDDKNGNCRDLWWTIKEYKSFLSKLLDFLRKARVTSQIQPALIACIFNCIESSSIKKASIAGVCTNSKFLDLSTVSKDKITEVLQRIDKLLKDRQLPWEKTDMSRPTEDVLSNVLDNYFGKGNNPITAEHHTLFLSIVATCGDGDSIEEQFYQEEEPDRPSVYFHIYRDIIKKLVDLHQNSKSGETLYPIIADLIKWASISAEEDHDKVTETVFRHINVIAATIPAILKEYLPKLVDIFIHLDGRNDHLSGVVHKLYPLNPKPVHSRLQDIVSLLDCDDARVRYWIMIILYAVSKKHPEVFSNQQVSRLLQVCRTDEQLVNYALLAIQEVASMNPKLVAPQYSTLVDDNIFKPESLTWRAGILASIGRSDQGLGQKSIDYLMKYSNNKDHNISLSVLNTVRRLTPKHIDYMQKHRAEVEKTEQTTNNQDVKDLCHQIILVIDGISIEEVFEDVKQQQEDISELDTKVDATIDTVQNIGEHVIDHHKQIKGVKKDMEHIEERVDEAEDNIEKTNHKVEEIDNKTMTNAPNWSRDLTKLMNPKTDNDWRLLASRLGYSNTDIRGWAQQNDPCMALLSEWYATHKTSEASHAVLTALQEMNRVDGAAIVENAMKAAEGVVEDEEFEYASPPPIFLSYQWGVQDEVRLLQRHLNMAGYECWMDIGQMGGGDKLFAKIDNGIRAAKVVICCTTEKYAQSPNCNREVNLSVNLGKPIIPLLMEKMAWPPKGSMGPIFSEYLFIRFFQRGDEETKDQRYWPVPKFQELLMQLNYYVMPDPKLIKKDYKDWWKPIAEIVIDTKKAKTNAPHVQSTAQVDQKAQPLVFLSYQWGKQPQVKVLYQRLTSLGYTVWMDIYQMGGGDSLYDKIDRGLRGCKAVVTCVTPKYALSANCRREVSLADALKKPIIPLLLETMTWPPDGPMSMVFTQLLYINFYRDPDVQMTWKGPSFNELCDKLQENIPEIGQPNRDVRKSNDTSSGRTPAPNNSKPAGSSVTKEGSRTTQIDTAKSDSKTVPRSNRSTVTKSSVDTSKDNESKESNSNEISPNGSKFISKATQDDPNYMSKDVHGINKDLQDSTIDTVAPKSSQRTNNKIGYANTETAKPATCNTSPRNQPSPFSNDTVVAEQDIVNNAPNANTSDTISTPRQYSRETTADMTEKYVANTAMANNHNGKNQTHGNGARSNAKAQAPANSKSCIIL